MLRWLTAGESHGRALLAICEGVPAGVEVTTADVAAALARRRAGYGRGARMKFEQDEVELTGGVRHGRTLGGPVAIRIGNTEWPKWETVMAAGPGRRGRPRRPGPERAADPAPARPRRPGRDAEVRLRRRPGRPGAGQRPGDGGPGRAGRGRAPLPAPGPRAPRSSATSSPSARCAPRTALAPLPGDLDRVDADPVRCLDPAASAAMQAEIDAAKRDGDTLGGIVEVVVYGLPPGLGSHVHWDRRLDGRLAGALMSIQAIKGVEIGDGLRHRGPARLAGPRRDREHATAGVRRLTNRAGGIEGGMSTGEPVRVRAAMKPISTVPRALATDRRPHRRARQGHQPAQRRDRGARRRRRRRGHDRADRWPTPRWRSSAATRSRRPPATTTAT